MNASEYRDQMCPYLGQSPDHWAVVPLSSLGFVVNLLFMEDVGEGDDGVT